MDVDRFLEINTQFGNDVGDMVLTTLAQRVGANVRSSDLMARYSGDQFAIVLPNTDEAGARVVADKLRGDVEQMQWQKIGGKELRVTVSIGCAQFSMQDVNPETLLRDAKMALNAAKEAGRNQVASG
jgi:diguanylate cyclase (GGDEF)-like protein